MLYGAGNEGKTVVFKHFLDESDKNNAKHIAREVQEFLTASHIANVVAGMFALCRAFAHIFRSSHACSAVMCMPAERHGASLQACTVPLCDDAVATRATDKVT
jgi:hypothetical protein